jgi:hypothetical protein
MASKSMGYDNPAYQARVGECMGEAGGGATTQYAKFVAFTAMQAFSAQFTVTAAGTATTHLFSVLKIAAGGTATTTIATQTLGTATVGSTFNLLFPAGTATATAAGQQGGLNLNQGDVLTVISGADAAGKAAVALEVGLAPLGNVTV